MDRFSEILLDVWKEACRHIGAEESTATIAQLLRSRMPLEQVAVCRLDGKRRSLETVALGVPGPAPPFPTRLPCPPERWQELADWCREGELSRPGEGNGCPLPLPPGEDRDVLAGPLAVDGEEPGVLLLLSPPGERFTTVHRRVAGILLEPFSAVLSNDTRLRELKSLRDAAEADRRTLLTRLGKREVEEVIVGADRGLRSVMERVELVAPSDVPVLFLGETGTGKEVMARAIHSRSPRAHGPIVRVNCGAIPPELIDSQLFGHEKGAFTGALQTGRGWFERAHGGTLFLDEIGELSLAAQVRLLRVLQDGSLERIGGSRPIFVDVRLIAATNRDLASMVAAGGFREDLWYRISAFPIIIPPLRERREDIPPLARHLADKAAIRLGLPPLMPDRRQMELLLSYPWPGNVRELGSVINRAAILGNGRRLEVAKALGVPAPAGADTRGGSGEEEGGAAAPFPSLEHKVREHIEAALSLTGGRVEGPHGAARLLSINPNTLRSRMRRLGIERGRFAQAGSGGQVRR